MVAVTDATFEKIVLGAERPVLVDFGAPWCHPCKAVDRVLAELEAEYGERLVFAKVDIDASPAHAARYGVLSIPTVILFDGGEVRETIVGSKPRAHFERLLARLA